MRHVEEPKVGRCSRPHAGRRGLLAVALTSCSGKQQEPPKKDVHLKGAGASFPNVLYQHWFKKFNVTPEKVSVEYELVGSGGGVKQFLAGDEDRKVDFGASDNGMTSEEAAKVKRGVVAGRRCAAA